MLKAVDRKLVEHVRRGELLDLAGADPIDEVAARVIAKDMVPRLVPPGQMPVPPPRCRYGAQIQGLFGWRSRSAPTALCRAAAGS